jgi:hypothetical protein
MLSRRGLIAGATLLAVPPSLPDWAGRLVAQAAALRGPGLLQSYVTLTGADALAFDRVHGNCAYVYDNAVAGFALIAAGRPDLAARIGSALLAAQQRDRFWLDGRLRNAYRAGPMPDSGPYPLPGWWDANARHWAEDPYHAGTATGVLAWAMLLWRALAVRGFGPGFDVACQRAQHFIARKLMLPNGFAGGFFGFEPAPEKLLWASTEHAADLAALAGARGDAPLQTHARDFLARVFDAKKGRFAAGLTPAGDLNPLAAIDANLWPGLLPKPDPAWARTLNFVLSKTPKTGTGFAVGLPGLWLEGTAIAALCLARAGNRTAASRLLDTVAHFTGDRMVFATDQARLPTGLAIASQSPAADFFYYKRQHLAPLAWAVLAERRANPYELALPDCSPPLLAPPR